MPNKSTTVKPTVPKKRKVYNAGRFFSTKVDVNEKYVTIRLPKKVAEYLDVANGNKIYWSPVNGVVQVSGKVPNLTIPVMNVAASGFIPHSEHDESE